MCVEEKQWKKKYIRIKIEWEWREGEREIVNKVKRERIERRKKLEGE